MATFTVSLLRTCNKCRQIIKPSLSFARNTYLNSRLKCEQNVRLLTTAPPPLNNSSLNEENVAEKPDYPTDFEVSYDEFKYVLPLLPRPTVPELPKHATFPTPSGWFPPNEELIAKQTFLIRRTKNHLLPVYPELKRVQVGPYKAIKHSVIIRKIEGDIWALEAELREYLLEKTGLKVIKTQVHEVGRFIRIRGMHRPLVAEFMFERGM
ncbi:unnamed protein product [Lymnaea stagnalis]|uniref:Large ribosomal subunit protein mL49 n=1 Tax=Lymnaea stagnalis TaxID=6523 RepID=A0AAV2H309_LYMST